MRHLVSWCANECGYIDAGVVPKFAGCVQGSRWFKERGLWQDKSYTPSPGGIVLFDWDDPGGFSGPQGIVRHGLISNSADAQGFVEIGLQQRMELVSQTGTYIFIEDQLIQRSHF